MEGKADSTLLTQAHTNGILPSKNELFQEDTNTSCGLGKYTPKWLQLFASKKAYVIIYGLLGMNQAAIGSYFIGTISTIEKRFKLPSSTFGFIASSWDIGVICTVLVIGYLGSTGHKTKWVAICAIFAALSCYLRYLPHILFGTSSSTNVASKISSFHLCNEALTKNENCVLNSDGFITTIIFTMAHISLGVGTATYSTLGAAYLDDNSLKDKAPFLISLASCFRHLGPTVGFILASYALKISESPDLMTPYSQNDQRYIGAWHLGWVPLGTVHILLALMMAFFPRTLPREAQRRKIRKSMLESNENTKWSLKDLKCRITSLLKNRVLMFNAISSTCYMFGAIGYRIFLPKYIEAQFMQSASRANLITGTLGIMCSLFGVLLSGSFISKFKPSARHLAAWSNFTKIIEFLAYVMFAFISCEKGVFYGVSEDRFNFVSKCNEVCECSPHIYSPVCDMNEGTTYFSPCQAGCTTNSSINGAMVFGECSCIPGQSFAKEGACSTNCEDHFILFVTLLCFLKFLSATGKSGSTILLYRSVDPVDKSLSIALSEVMLSCLSFIPAPIVYGSILDSSCLLWEEECGEKGNCLLYDERKLRFYSNFTSSGFMFLSAVFDFGLYRSVKMLSIYDDEPTVDGASEKLKYHQNRNHAES